MITISRFRCTPEKRHETCQFQVSLHRYIRVRVPILNDSLKNVSILAREGQYTAKTQGKRGKENNQNERTRIVEESYILSEYYQENKFILNAVVNKHFDMFYIIREPNPKHFYPKGQSKIHKPPPSEMALPWKIFRENVLPWENGQEKIPSSLPHIQKDKHI